MRANCLYLCKNSSCVKGTKICPKIRERKKYCAKTPDTALQRGLEYDNVWSKDG